METLGAYGSDDEAAPAPKPEYRDYSMAVVSAAPAVGMLSAAHLGSQLLRHNQKEISTNLPIEVLMAPVQGPANPFTFNSSGAEGGGRRVGMGVIEDAAVEDWTFDEQYQTYQRSGFAVDLSTNQVLGNYGEYLKSGGETAQSVRGAAMFAIQIRNSSTDQYLIAYVPLQSSALRLGRERRAAGGSGGAMWTCSCRPWRIWATRPRGRGPRA
jgi:pre-mRNA-processing factor 17